MLNRNIITAGAMGSALAVLSLSAMALIVFPADIAYPGLDVLTRKRPLTGAESERFIQSMQYLFALDSFFLIGWIVSWIGIAELMVSRFVLLAKLSLFFGLTGALFDLAENSIIWSALLLFQDGSVISADWLVAWRIIHHFSYWLPFLGALIASIGIWSANVLDRVTVAVGTLGVAFAIGGLYLPYIDAVSTAWFMIWFILAGQLMAKRAYELKSRIDE